MTSSHHSSSGKKIFFFDFTVLDLTFFSKFTRLTNDFQVVGFLGNGTFGKVIHGKFVFTPIQTPLVRHKLNGREYAIKVIEIWDRKITDVILREIKMCSKLDHPNVVVSIVPWMEKVEFSFCFGKEFRSTRRSICSFKWSTAVGAHFVGISSRESSR